MTSKEAVSIVQKAYPKHTVTLVMDYDKQYFIVEALPPGVDKSFDDPYFAVDKKTGKLSFYSPAGDFENFFDAIENRSVKL